MNREDDPKLWDLLGRAQKVEPSPFFARNVVRAIRLRQPEKAQWIGRLNLLRTVQTLTPVAMVAVVINAPAMPPVIRPVTDAIIPRRIVRIWIRIIAVAVWIAIEPWQSDTYSNRNSSIRVGSRGHDEAECDQ